MPGTHDRNTAVIEVLPATADRPRVMYRYAGDRFILVEYGEMVLDLTMNFRIFGLNDTLKKAELDGLVETVPALRSMLIQYDSRRLPTRMLVDTLKKLEETVPPGENLNIPSRRVELPIAFADRWTRADIERYVKYTRQDAPKNRKSTRLNSRHSQNPHAVFCLKKKKPCPSGSPMSSIYRTAQIRSR